MKPEMTCEHPDIRFREFTPTACTAECMHCRRWVYLPIDPRNGVESYQARRRINEKYAHERPARREQTA